MKKIVSTVLVFLLTFSNIAMATNPDAETGLPWEKAISLLEQSLFYIGGLLVLIGLLWAGYGFMVQQEKEAGFKRLIGTFIGGAIIFGAKGIVNLAFGASF